MQQHESEMWGSDDIGRWK